MMPYNPLARTHALSIQFPYAAVFGVFHLKSGFGKGITNLVARSPVFLSLGLGTQFEHHVDHLAVCLFTGIRRIALLLAQAEDVAGKETHGLVQLLQTVGADSSLVVEQLVDHAASLEQIADDQRCAQIIVHGIVAFLSQLANHLFGLLVTFVGRLDALQVVDTVHQSLQAILAGEESLVAEIHRTTIVG